MQHFGAASAKRTCCWSTSWSLLCGLVSRLQYSCECHAPTETKLVPCEDVYYACTRIIDIRFIYVYMYMCMHICIYICIIHTMQSQTHVHWSVDKLLQGYGSTHKRCAHPEHPDETCAPGSLLFPLHGCYNLRSDLIVTCYVWV